MAVICPALCLKPIGFLGMRKGVKKMDSLLLKMSNISKSFASNKVLTRVQLELRAGEVMGLLGENGAGKSTLMKILGGIYTKDEGEIAINGQPVEIRSVADARSYGISIIHQELMLSPHLSVAENVFMGHEQNNKLGFVDLSEQERITQQHLDEYGLGISATALIGSFSISQRQMVEIIRAVSFGAKIIVMDEPTSSLSNQEVQILYDIIRRLKAKNVGIIYISHRLNELFEICDRITVLRDGEYVDVVETAQTERQQLISMMVGRELSNYYTKTSTATNQVMLEVNGISDGGRVKDVSFVAHKGEVLGVAGLMGSGRSETMKCLFGLSLLKAGEIRVEGQLVHFNNPREAMRAGIAFVPEDRKQDGLFMQQDIRYNTTITVLERFLKCLRYDRHSEEKLVEQNIRQMQVKTTGADQVVSKLSGGNQQKVLIGRWLLTAQKILILDEPTRGVDIKTKADIYYLINELAKSGLCIIMVSSELPELINMSDRVVVFCEGRTTGLLEKDKINQEKIMTLATMDSMVTGR